MQFFLITDNDKENKLKKANQELVTKNMLLINGYIRILQCCLSCMIPDTLYILCQSFYHNNFYQNELNMHRNKFESLENIILHSVQQNTNNTIQQQRFISFLLSLPDFPITPITLIQMLETLFFTEPSPYLPSSTISTKQVRAKIIANFKVWFNNYWIEDFQINKECVNYIENQFCNRIQQYVEKYNDDEEKGGIMIAKILKQSQLIQIKSTDDEEAKFKRISQVSDETQKQMQLNILALLKLDTRKFAEQLTLYEANLFKQLRYREFINSKWNEKKRSKNVSKLIERWNHTGKWIIFAILTADGLKMRIKIKQYFIDIAKHLEEIGNFNSMCSYNAALYSASIHHLKTLSKKTSKKHKNELERIHKLCAGTAGYSQLRVLHKREGTKIPHIGLFFRDITMLREQVAFKRNDEIIYINCSLCDQAYHLLQKHLTSFNYQYKEREKYQKYIKNIYVNTVIDLDENQLYQLSKSVSISDGT